MKLIVRYGEVEREVLLQRDGSAARVEIAGETMELEVRHLAGGVRSILCDGVHQEVMVRHLGEDRYEVSGSSGAEVVEVLDPLTYLAAKTHEAQVGSARELVTAYMPGRVVKVLVSEGEALAPGQGVLVLEAMKMENEILAERGGVLRRMFVAEGQAVEGGDDLYEFESD